MVSNQGKITTLAADANVDKGLVDGTDKLHSGIIKVLESFAQGDVCIGHAGFTITNDGTYTQYNLAQPIEYTAKGEYDSYGTNLTVAYSSTVQDATNSRYDWVLLNPSVGGTPSIVIVQGTAGTTPLVSDITTDHIPIALVHISAGNDDDKTDYSFQTFTLDKGKNSLSILHGGNQIGKITADADSIDIVSTATNADINLTPHGTGKVTIEALLHVETSGTGDAVIIESTDTGGGGLAPDLVLKRNTSVASEELGNIRFLGLDDGAAEQEYADLYAGINTNTAGNESGEIFLRTIHNGTLRRRIDITKNEFVINEDGIDSNFRIEGSSEANLFFTDAGNDRVGIGTDSPAVKLHITSGGSGEPKITIENTNADSQEAQLEFKKNGTSPANSDDLGIIRFVGDDSAGSAHLYAYMFVDGESITAGSENGRMFFFISKAGTTVETLGLSHDEVVVNEAGLDTNFRVESDNDANMLFVDAGNDRVGIGTNSPSTLLEVSGEITASDVTATSAVTANTALTTNGLLFRRPEVLDNNASPPHAGPISGTVSVIYINDITATTPPAPPNPSPNAVQLPDPATVANTIFTLSNIGGATVAITVLTGEPINDNSTAHRLITTPNQIDLPAGDAIR